MCIYRDYCVYIYKSTELVSLYTLDIGLKINIIIIIILNFSVSQLIDNLISTGLVCLIKFFVIRGSQCLYA